MSNKIYCRLERINKDGYNENGTYFGVPHLKNGVLQRVYRINSETICNEFVRAGSRQEALAIFNR